VKSAAILALEDHDQSLFLLDNKPDHIVTEEGKDEVEHHMTVIPHKDNTLSHVDKTNCPRFTNMTTLSNGRSETKKMMKSMSKAWEKKFFPRLRKLAGMPDAKVGDLKHLCTYLYWAIEAKLDLKIDLNEEDIRYINSVSDSKYYSRHLAEPQLAALSNYEFFKQFNEFVQTVRGDKHWKDLPYFAKYFKKSQ